MKTHANLIVIIAFMVVACSKTQIAELSRWKHSSHIIVSTDEYDSRLLRVLDYAISPGAETRRSEYVNILRPLNGHEAQMLRVLLWARESDSQNRRELLDQFLYFSQSEPLGHGLKEELLKYTACRTNDDIASRCLEIDFAISERPKITYDIDLIVRSPGDLMIPEFGLLHDSNSPTHMRLMDLSPDERIALYRQFSLPMNGEGSGVEIARGGLYLLLWVIEPDRRIKENLLLPTINIDYSIPFADKVKNITALHYCPVRSRTMSTVYNRRPIPMAIRSAKVPVKWAFSRKA